MPETQSTTDAPTKQCYTCLSLLPQTDTYFHFRQDTKRFRNTCKKCHNKQQREWNNKISHGMQNSHALPPLPPLPFRIMHIPNHPGYAVTETGEVWSCRRRGRGPEYNSTWHHVKGSVSLRGYMIVQIRYRKKMTIRYVHQLVLETFVGPRPDKTECCHADGDRTNNRLENLRWGSRQDNIIDAIFHETRPHKIPNTEVSIIRQLHYSGQSLKQIANQYSVTKQAIWLIVKGKNRQHI